MFFRFIFAILFACFGKLYSNLLDPNVFRSLSQLSLPDVGNKFGIPFRFNTFHNVLGNAVPTNATYNVHVAPATDSPSVVNLFIPIEECNMRGVFQSQLAIPSRPLSRGREPALATTFYNQGRYEATMARVFMTFTVHITREGSRTGLDLNHCSVVMEEIAVDLVEENLDHSQPRLSRDFLRAMMNMVSKEEYGEMFCIAMRRILDSQDGVIVEAILRRYNQTEAPKSG